MEGVFNILSSYLYVLVFIAFMHYLVQLLFSREENPEERGEHLEKKSYRAEKLAHQGSTECFITFYFKNYQMMICEKLVL
jgi:hypothetical protein